MSDIRYETHFGKYMVGDSTRLLAGKPGKELANKVHLILTSPPFPLNNKKRYGNKQGEDYREWFANLAEVFAPLLTERVPSWSNWAMHGNLADLFNPC